MEGIRTINCPRATRLYGGLTAEQAWIGDDRWLLAPEGTIDSAMVPVSQTLRAGAMVLEFHNRTADQWFGIENVEIAATLGERLANTFTKIATDTPTPARSPLGNLGDDVAPTPPPPGAGPGDSTPAIKGGSTGDNVNGISALSLGSDDPDGTPDLNNDRFDRMNHGGTGDPVFPGDDVADATGAVTVVVFST